MVLVLLNSAYRARTSLLGGHRDMGGCPAGQRDTRATWHAAQHKLGKAGRRDVRSHGVCLPKNLCWALLSWKWPDSCLLMGSSKRIPWFAFRGHMAFALPGELLSPHSTHEVVHFHLSDRLPTSSWCWAASWVNLCQGPGAALHYSAFQLGGFSDAPSY